MAQNIAKTRTKTKMKNKTGAQKLQSAKNQTAKPKGQSGGNPLGRSTMPKVTVKQANPAFKSHAVMNSEQKSGKSIKENNMKKAALFQFKEKRAFDHVKSLIAEGQLKGRVTRSGIEIYEAKTAKKLTEHLEKYSIAHRVQIFEMTVPKKKATQLDESNNRNKYLNEYGYARLSNVDNDTFMMMKGQQVPGEEDPDSDKILDGPVDGETQPEISFPNANDPDAEKRYGTKMMMSDSEYMYEEDDTDDTDDTTNSEKKIKESDEDEDKDKNNSGDPNLEEEFDIEEAWSDDIARMKQLAGYNLDEEKIRTEPPKITLESRIHKNRRHRLAV